MRIRHKHYQKHLLFLAVLSLIGVLFWYLRLDSYRINNMPRFIRPPDAICYDLKLRSDTRLVKGFPVGDPLISNFVGVLLLKQVSSDEAGYLLLGRFLLPESQPKLENISLLPTSEFTLRLSRNGLFTDFNFSRAVGEDDRELVISIFKMLEFFSPAPRLEVSWVSEQEDLLGRYRAQYLVSADSISKRKLLYVDSGNSTEVKVRRYKGNAKLAIEDLWYSSVGITESLAIITGNNEEIVMDVSLEMHTDISDSKYCLKDEKFFDNKSKISQGNTVVSGVPTSEKSKLGGASSLDSYISRLKALSVGGGNKASAIIHWVDDVSSYLEQNPEDLEGVETLLRGETLAGKDKGHLYYALQKTDSAKAVSVLTTLANDTSISTLDRKRAIIALAASDVRASIVPDFLVTLAQSVGTDYKEVRDTALLNIGVSIERLLGVDPLQASKSFHELEADILQTKDEDVLAVKLTSAGNSAHPGVVDLVRKYTESGNSNVRFAAYQALRKVNDVSAFEMLFEGLRKEKDPSVRSAIVSSLDSQQVTDRLLKEVYASASIESDLRTRKQLVKKLTKESKDFPYVKSYLKTLIMQESDPEIYEELVQGLP